MKDTFKKLVASFSGVSALGIPLGVLAQFGGGTGGGTAPALPPAPFNSIDELLGTTGVICNIFRYIFFFLVLIAVVFILLAAFKYVTAGGDAEKVKTANKEIAYAAIAIIIGFIARVIPNIALTLVGSASGVESC